MITESDLYLITRLDYICLALNIVLGLSAVVGGFSTVYAFITWLDVTEYEQTTKRRIRQMTVVAAISLVLVCVFGSARILIPTTKELAVVKMVPALTRCAEDPVVKAEFKELYSLAVDGLKKELQEKGSAGR